MIRRLRDGVRHDPTNFANLDVSNVKKSIEDEMNQLKIAVSDI